MAGAQPAQAQFFGFFEPAPRPYYRPNRSFKPQAQIRRQRPASHAVARKDDDGADKAVAAAPPNAQMIYAVVSLADQHINVYGTEGLIARSRVSTGQTGFRTPTGIYGILEKHRVHESNIYEGAEMPFMQRLTWSGIALHQGIVPRYPASHGCVRLPAAFAAKLWDMTKVGARVVVASSEVKPVAISHARLPVAQMVPGDVLGLQAEAAPEHPEHGEATVIRVAATGSDAGLPQSRRRYNPIEVAALLKTRAQTEIRNSTKRAELGRAEARAAAAAANSAAEAVRDARDDLAEARTKNAPPERIAEIERRLAEAQALDAERAPLAMKTALVVRDAERTAEAAREAASVAGRRAAPLSVLISAKEGLVFVKQGQKPVYEAPFKLRDPGAPLGTHLFVATAPEGEDGQLRWSALTVSGDTGKDAKAGGDDVGKQVSKAKDGGTTAAIPAASTASEALDRITLAPETERKLAELIWVGGSIIVTDRGVGPDYGEHTDMVIALP